MLLWVSVPSVDVLGFFSRRWAPSLALQATPLPLRLSVWLGACRQQGPQSQGAGTPIPGRGASLLSPSRPPRASHPARAPGPMQKGCALGPVPERDIPPPLPPTPPLLNPGFPARLAGAGALVFRGEGGGSVRILSKGEEGPCSGGFRTLSGACPHSPWCLVPVP